MLQKSDPSSLAVFGGSPAFKEKLHVGRPNVGDRERLLGRLGDLLDRRWLTNDGPYVRELERRIAALVGVKHCVAICNGTVALEIAARATGLTDEVIVPSFTFVATAHALQWLGIRPVFCDIDPRTHNLNPHLVRELITSRTTGIIGVHLWGRPCDAEALARIAHEHGLRLLFDAAHAFGCSYQGRMIGGLGDAEVFSFHATKYFNTGEGGAIVTDDDKLASDVRLMRDFGFAGPDKVISIGTNGKMSEVSAAMGLTLLEDLDELLAANLLTYQEYRQGLEGIPGITLLTYDETEECNYQYAVIEIDATAAGISRDQLAAILWAENVLARRYFYPGCHRMEPYRSHHPDLGPSLLETESISERVLCLPAGSAVRLCDVRGVCQIVRMVVANGQSVSDRLKGRSPG